MKLFSNDIGLLSCQLFDRENAVKVMQGDCTINFGAPFENVVAEELASKGYPHYYYNHKKCGEIDSLIQKKDRLSLWKSNPEIRMQRANMNIMLLSSFRNRPGNRKGICPLEKEYI